jgi:hypothetical protein
LYCLLDFPSCHKLSITTDSHSVSSMENTPSLTRSACSRCSVDAFQRFSEIEPDRPFGILHGAVNVRDPRIPLLLISYTIWPFAT